MELFSKEEVTTINEVADALERAVNALEKIMVIFDDHKSNDFTPKNSATTA